MKSMSLSLRAKILMLTVGSVFTFGLIVFGVFTYIENQQKNKAALSYYSHVQKLSNAIQAQFFERYGDVQAFSQTEAVRSLDPKRIVAYLDQMITTYGIYDLILVTDANGKFVAANTNDFGKKPVNQDALKNHNFANEGWFRAVTEGKTTDDAENAYAGTYFEGLFEDSMQDLAFGEKRIASGFSTAIKNEKGEVIGVITNRAGSRWVDFEFTNAYTQLINVGEPTSRLVLLDENGNKLIDLNPSKNQGKNEVTYNSDFSRKNYAKAGFHFAEKLMKGESSYGEWSNPETKSAEVGGFTRIIGPKWPKASVWSLAVLADEADVFEEINFTAKVFYTVSIGFAVLCVMFGLWLTNKISNVINAITERVKSETDRIADETLKISESSNELSSGAAEQAAAIQETMAAIDEINATVEKNAEAADRSKQVSLKSREAARTGKTNVDEMISSIAQISQSNESLGSYMNENNRKLSEITNLILGIEEKTKVINDIVFQTKLLSFNASVEAARAGEYGKGFAVVAEEVGNLAQMSGQAAKEIFAILGNSVQKVQSIVTETKTRVDDLVSNAKTKVQTGTQTAQKCRESLDVILGDVEAVDALVTEIAVASREQAKGVGEISKAVGQLDQVTQQNSSVAQESATSVSKLNGQTSELRGLVKDMFVFVKGGSNDGTPSQELPSNVRPLRAEKSAPVSVVKKVLHNKAEVKTKKVVGNGEEVPSFDDPGFEEV
jgi:methyl-accepting chemotaxis protein